MSSLSGSSHTQSKEYKKLIEIIGLAIFGVIGFIAVFAMINTTFYAAIIGLFNSVASMFVGVVTGASNLLTAWAYWATDYPTFTNYAGLTWLAMWIIVLVYAGFEIAISRNDRGWRNAVGRGSNYLGLVLCLFLVVQPIGVSYASTFLADQTQLSAVDYVPQTQITSIGFASTNATNTYWETQTGVLYDNDTYSIIKASAVIDTVTARTSSQIRTTYNSTFLYDSDITQIKVDYTYIGTGNITEVRFVLYSGSTITLASTTTDFDGSFTYTLQTYESAMLKGSTYFYVYLFFEDSPYFVNNGDYIEVSTYFYEATTLFTAEFVTQMLAWALALIDFVIVMVASKAYIWIAKKI